MNDWMSIKVTDWVIKNNLCEKAKCSYYNKEEQMCNSPTGDLNEIKKYRCPNRYWYANWSMVK